MVLTSGMTHTFGWVNCEGAMCVTTKSVILIYFETLCLSQTPPVAKLNNWTRAQYTFALQSVLNVAIRRSIRLFTNTSKQGRITPLLRDRHWLPIKQCIDYKLCDGASLSAWTDSFYLIELITPSAATHTQAGLRSAEMRRLSPYQAYTHHLEIGHLPSQLPTISHYHFLRSSPLTDLQETWRHSYIALFLCISISQSVSIF